MLKSFLDKNKIEAGVDEAGRGCLAGPVFAAAVILPKNFRHKLLNDSKQVKEKDREKLREIIIEESVAWAVAFCNQKKIDKINILNASFKAMNEAIFRLRKQPQHLLIDGNRFKNETEYAYTCIIKGDGKYKSIAAASILAKTFRDDFMRKIDLEFPQYNWKQNKGYGTLHHREMIRQHGACVYHRRSFDLLGDGGQLSLFEKK